MAAIDYICKFSASKRSLASKCIIFMLLLNTQGFAATRTSTIFGGNWNSITTWVGGVLPLPGDNVIIATTGTDAVTVDGIRTCFNLTINSRGRLIIGGTNTLNVNGTVSMPRPASGQINELNVDDGNLNVAGTFTMSATTGTRHNILNITSGTVTVNGITTSGAASRVNLNGNGRLDISGVVTSTNVTLTAGTGSVNYTGDVPQAVWQEVYYDLGISGTGIKTLVNTTIVGHVATIDGILSLGARSLILTGGGTPLVVNNQLDPATGTVVYGSDDSQTVAEMDYFTLTLSGAGVKTLPDGFTAAIGRDFNVESTTILAGNASVDITRDIAGAGTLEMQNGTLIIGRNNTRTGTFIPGSGTVNYSRSGVQIIRAVEYFNLKLSQSGNKSFPDSVNVVIKNDLDVSSPLTIPGIATVDIKGNIIGTGSIIVEQGVISLEGDWMNDGNLESGSGTIRFNGSGDQIVAGNDYYNLETGESGIKVLSAEAVVRNVLTVGAGTELDLDSHDLTLSGAGTPLISNGTFSPAVSTVKYTNPTETQIAALNYHNLDATGGPRKLAESGEIGVSGTFTPGTGNYVVINSTVKFNGVNQTIPPLSFNNIILSGAGVKEITSTVNVKTMAIENGAILNLKSTEGGKIIVH